jgi:hypothetical protein
MRVPFPGPAREEVAVREERSRWGTLSISDLQPKHAEQGVSSEQEQLA